MATSPGAVGGRPSDTAGIAKVPAGAPMTLTDWVLPLTTMSFAVNTVPTAWVTPGREATVATSVAGMGA